MSQRILKPWPTPFSIPEHSSLPAVIMGRNQSWIFLEDLRKTDNRDFYCIETEAGAQVVQIDDMYRHAFYDGFPAMLNTACTLMIMTAPRTFVVATDELVLEIRSEQQPQIIRICYEERNSFAAVMGNKLIGQLTSPVQSPVETTLAKSVPKKTERLELAGIDTNVLKWKAGWNSFDRLTIYLESSQNSFCIRTKDYQYYRSFDPGMHGVQLPQGLWKLSGSAFIHEVNDLGLFYLGTNYTSETVPSLLVVTDAGCLEISQFHALEIEKLGKLPDYKTYFEAGLAALFSDRG